MGIARQQDLLVRYAKLEASGHVGLSAQQVRPFGISAGRAFPFGLPPERQGSQEVGGKTGIHCSPEASNTTARPYCPRWGYGGWGFPKGL